MRVILMISFSKQWGKTLCPRTAKLSSREFIFQVPPESQQQGRPLLTVQCDICLLPFNIILSTSAAFRKLIPRRPVMRECNLHCHIFGHITVIATVTLLSRPGDDVYMHRGAVTCEHLLIMPLLATLAFLFSRPIGRFKCSKHSWTGIVLIFPNLKRLVNSHCRKNPFKFYDYNIGIVHSRKSFQR